MVKRVVWLSDFPLRGSSFGTVTYELLIRMPEYQFDVLSLGYKGIPLKLNDHIRILELEKAYQIRYYFKKLNPDVTVVFHSFWLLESLMPEVQCLRGRRILYIPIEGESVPEQYRHIFTNFEQILTPSKFSARVLKKAGFKSEVIPHGVDLDFFKPEKKKWHEFRFGYLGMNDVRKQIPRIMEAYARLKRGILAIASEQEGHYNLASLAKELKIRPVFVERKLNDLTMSRESVRDFLKSLDVYLSPASESFGIPALEAQACGVVPIALDHGASREVLGNGALYAKVSDYLHTSVGKVGLVSIPDLYRKMRFLIDVPQAYEKLRKRAIENAQKWSWDKAVEKMKEVIG